MGWHDCVDRAAELGVSEPELMVMNVVRYHVPMHCDRFAWWVLKEFDHWDHPWDIDDIESAIGCCLGKGWLRMLTPFDVMQEPPEFSTYLRYFSGSVGLLDWTEEGNALARKIFGDKHIHRGA